MKSEDGRQFWPVYFDFIDSKAFNSISSQAFKLYVILRRYICRTREGHSLSDFYVKGALAVSGFLNQYAQRLGVSKQTVSRWISELEEAKFLVTYKKATHDQSIDNPNIWILGRVLHVEGSAYGVEVFFADHDALAQEQDADAKNIFDQGMASALWANMPATEEAMGELAKITEGVPPMEHPVPPMEHRMEQGVPPVLRSNKEDLIDKSNNKRLSPAKSPNYMLEFYVKDKKHVSAVGTVSRGPWSVVCPECGGDVVIDALNNETECLCGMHSFLLYGKKRGKKHERLSESIEAYYGVVRSRGVRHGSNETWHAEIAEKVKDVQFWTQVVKEWIAQGWNPLSVDRMLLYYEDRRLPGTRKTGQEGPELESGENGEIIVTPQGKQPGTSAVETVSEEEYKRLFGDIT